MSFYWINVLWLLAIPAILLVLEIRGQRGRAVTSSHPKIVRAEAGTKTLQLTTTTQRESRKSHWRLILGLALAIVALARPQWGHLEEPVFDQAREIMIALDLSRSMLSPDVKPTRLDRAKLLVQSLLERLSGERVGLIVFSGTAFLQSPLSSDYEILNEFLPEMNPDYLPEGGTNYSDLINTAISGFGSSSSADRYLIILSDGEATDDDWKTAADKLKGKGIRVIGLGVGTAQGAMIPDGAGSFMKDERGAVVLSKIEPATLKALADLTNGVYSDASSWVDLAQLLKTTVETGAKGKFREERNVRLVERYQWALAPALVLLLWSFWQEFPVYPRPRDIKLHGATSKGPPSSTPPPLPPVVNTIVPLIVFAFLLFAFAPRVYALTENPTAPHENSVAGPLTQLVTQFSAREDLNAREYAELAQATITYGNRLRESKKPMLEGPIHDGLSAVEKGAALDPHAADWDKFKNQLEQLLEKPPTPTPPPQNQKDKDKQDKQDKSKDDESKQDQSKQDQSKEDSSKKDQSKQDQSQKDKSSDQSKGAQDKDDASKSDPSKKSGDPSDSGQPTPTPKPGEPNADNKSSDKQNDPSSSLGNMQQKPGAQPTPPPAPNSASPETQKVGGAPEKVEGEKPVDPALAVPLEKLQQVKEGDSPVKLQQIMRGDKQTPAKQGKNW